MVKTPPRRGPATDAIPKIAPTSPCSIGLLCSGTRPIMMTIAPEKMPLDPAPAMARPTMNTIELGAAPQIALPISKTVTEEMKTFLGL